MKAIAYHTWYGGVPDILFYEEKEDNLHIYSNFLFQLS